MSKLKFHHVGFYVDHLSDVRHLFEEQLGWKVDSAFTYMNEEIVFMKKKEMKIELISDKETTTPSFHIAFEVSSLQPYLNQSPVSLVEGPYEVNNWRIAFFQLEGLLIELMEKRPHD